ncbi:hydroxymethylglutaryl-CoA reductase [Candidatus Woesearchaeota archaeon]|nr:hydroxymethylglutaryl-CoA reductase [Candidatus Woesearchaeota archaeon]
MSEQDMKDSKIRLERSVAEVPTYMIDSIQVNGKHAQGMFKVPLATVETPVAIAVNRGKKATNMSGGIDVDVLSNCMTRGIILEADRPETAYRLVDIMFEESDEIRRLVRESTSFGCIESLDGVVSGSDAYLRLSMFPGDAAGHNMTTRAGAILGKYLEQLPELKGKVNFLSASSNTCADKKPAAINVKKGRGKHVVATAYLSAEILREILHVDPETLQRLNQKKNRVGSEIAGALYGNNSHYANIVAAIYLATGQDAANVVEGSMGTTSVELIGKEDIKFSVDIPCLIVGTVGGGTSNPYAQKHLRMMQCYGSGDPIGANGEKLAEIIGAAVLAGELNTLASLTDPEKHSRCHVFYERER